MEQKELNKPFVMISNWEKPNVLLANFEIFQRCKSYYFIEEGPYSRTSYDKS